MAPANAGTALLAAVGRGLSTTYLSSLQPRGSWLTHVPLCTLRKGKTQHKSGLGAGCEKMAISRSIRLTVAVPTELGAVCWCSGTCFIPGKLGKGCVGRGGHRAEGRRVGHPAHVKALLLRMGELETTAASLLFFSGAEDASCGWHGQCLDASLHCCQCISRGTHGCVLHSLQHSSIRGPR